MRNPCKLQCGVLTKIFFYVIVIQYFYGGIAQLAEQTAHIR